MAHLKHTFPTCKSCGKQHFNFTKCSDTKNIEIAQRLHAAPKPAVWIEPTKPFSSAWNKAASGGTLTFSSLPMKERGSVTGVSDGNG